MVIKNSGIQKDRRNNIRIGIDKPICAIFSISEIEGRTIATGQTKVCIFNIGPGGLAFTTDLNLPVSRDAVVFQFKTIICDDINLFKGTIVWKKELSEGLYEYGVKFRFDEMKYNYYVKLFNRLAITIKRGYLASSTVCSESCEMCRKVKQGGPG